MRCFIAIDITDEIKDKLLDVVKEIYPHGKFTVADPDNMHITVKFLGEVPEQDLDALREKLRSIKHDSYRMTVKDVGIFSHETQINVIWLGLADDNRTAILNAKINDKLDLFEDRKFTPHLTLARVKECDNNAVFNIIKKYKGITFGEIEVNHFTLYKSTLTTDGSIYEVIEKFNLS